MGFPGFEYSDIKIELEVKFIQFFHKIFESEIIKCGNILSTEILNKIKNAYSSKSIKKGVPNISFSSPETRCAYIFQYAPCFASAIAYDFQALLKENIQLFERLMLQDTVTVCFLGGGPGTEFIAVAKILEEMMWKYCPRAERPMMFDAVIIDADSGWKETLKLLFPYISSLLDNSLMQLKLSFIQADLAKPFTEDVKNAITRSDIVTMVKFLSAVSGGNAKNKVAWIVQETIEFLRGGNILFFLDSSDFRHFDALISVVYANDMISIDRGLEYSIYQISPYSLREFSKLYRRYLNKDQLCSRCTKNCIRVWCKTYPVWWITEPVIDYRFNFADGPVMYLPPPYPSY